MTNLLPAIALRHRGHRFETLKGHGDSIISVTFSPDGRLVTAIARPRSRGSGRSTEGGFWQSSRGMGPLSGT